jgi:Flp pilus assembly protein CpaB
MNSFVKIRIVLVIFIAMILSYTAYMILQSWKTEVDVVVAAVEIPELSLITPDMLRVEKVVLALRDTLAPRSVPTKDKLENKLAKVRIPAGRPIDSVYDVVSVEQDRISTDSLGRPDVSQGISESYILDRNERLIAVPVDISSTLTLREIVRGASRETKMINTKLRKGDLVDVVATYTAQNNEQASVLLAQRVLVHQVEVSEDGDSQERSIVILRTTPDIALDINFMRNAGKIDLILTPVNGIESNTRELNISKILDRSLSR